MNLSINLLKQLKALSGLIFISLLFFVFIFYFYESFSFKLIIWIVIPFVILFVFPVLFLHFNYLIKNEGLVFEINENTILRKKKFQISIYNSDDISEIIFYMNGFKGSANGMLPFEEYYYAQIYLKKGGCFIITCLNSNKIDKILIENFKDVKTTTIRTFFPVIS